MVVQKSRAEYFRERRKLFKPFTVNLPKETLERLEQNLEKCQKTKTAWVLEKIEQDFGEK